VSQNLCLNCFSGSLFEISKNKDFAKFVTNSDIATISALKIKKLRFLVRPSFIITVVIKKGIRDGLLYSLRCLSVSQSHTLNYVSAATPNLEQLEAMEYLKLEEIKSLINTIEKIGHEELTSDMTTHLSKYRQDPDAPNLLDDQEDYYTAGLILSISVIVVCCCCIINTLICFFLYLRPYLKLSNR
jgi:hypothetical protein